jgi:Bacterial Ig-like domain (group 3)/FG-GAP-like repeat
MFGAHSKFSQAFIGFCGAVLTFAVPALCLAQGATPSPLTVQNVTLNPVISPPDGYVKEASQKITITDATPGAVIYYSVGSGNPPPTTLYTGPFYVDGSQVEYVYATATAPGYLPSGVANAYYEGEGQASQITLGISPGASVAVGTAVTLAAQVSNTAKAHMDRIVLFCNAAVALCEDSALLGSAPIAPGGFAKARLQLGVGTYSIRAVYQGDNTYAPSTSAAQALVVRGKSVTSTGAVSAEQVNGVYNLTSQVAVFGRPQIGGTLTFKDSINGASPVTLGTTTLTSANTIVGLSAAATAAAAGPNSFALAVGDFNKDGFPDLVTANTGVAALSIVQGNGNGTFAAPSSVSLSTAPTSIVVGDLNADGFLDIAAAAPSNPYTDILLGAANGAFTFTNIGFAGEAITQNQVFFGDFNGDGLLDIGSIGVDPNQPANSQLTVQFNSDLGYDRGSGSVESFDLPVTPAFVTVGDFNGDGASDIATSNIDGTISILLNSNNPTGLTQNAFVVASTLNPGASGKLVTADFNGDGIPDLAAPGVNSVVVYLSKGDGTFTQASSLSAPNVQGFAVADFNGDGISDLIVTELINNQPSVVIFLGAGDGTFPGSTTPTATPFVVSPVIADFNGDGLPDLAALDPTSNTAGALLTNLITAGTLDGITLSKPGTHVITATYSGTSALASSVGSPLTIVVPAPNFASLTPVPVHP